jgi:hypothetical protein
VNDLLLLLVVVIAGVLGTSAIRQVRAGRSAARHHHRALDTLGTITAGRAQALQGELNGQSADELPAEPADDRLAGTAPAGASAPPAAAGQDSPVTDWTQGEGGAHHVPPHVRVVSADAPLGPPGPQLVRSSRRFPSVPKASAPGDAVRLRPPSGHDRRDTAEMVAVDPADAAPKPIRRPTLAPPPALGKVSPPPAGPLGGKPAPAGGNGSTWSPARPAAASHGGAGAPTGRVDPTPTPASPFPASRPSPEVVRVIDDEVLSSQPSVSAVPHPESVTGSPVERGGRSPRRPARRLFSDGRAYRRVEVPASALRRRRTRIGAGVAGAVVVLALAGALVSQRGGGSSNSQAVRPPPTAATPATTARPPTTTVPPSTTTSGPLAPLNSNAFAATYLVGSSPLTVSVSSGRSWVQIRTGGPSGTITFSGLMTAGQSQSVAAPAWIVLGNPAATSVTADGRPVGLPNPGSQQALTLTFQ